MESFPILITEESPIKDELNVSNDRYDELQAKLKARAELLELISEYMDLMGRLGETHDWIQELDEKINMSKSGSGDLESLQRHQDDFSVSCFGWLTGHQIYFKSDLPCCVKDYHAVYFLYWNVFKDAYWNKKEKLFPAQHTCTLYMNILSIKVIHFDEN